MHMNSTWLFYLVLREKSIQGIRNTHFIRLKKKTIKYVTPTQTMCRAKDVITRTLSASITSQSKVQYDNIQVFYVGIKIHLFSYT